MRRFTPEAMAEARKLMELALGACQTAMEYRRVKLADDSLRQFELFMTLRRDLFAGNFTALDSDAQRWMATHKSLAQQYKENYTFTKTGWAPDSVAVHYFKTFFNQTYADAAHIARGYTLLTPVANTWRYAVDRDKHGESLGRQQADFDDISWNETDVSMDTWATLGLMGYYGPVWYRRNMNIPDVPEGKKVFLWVGATDGRCKVYVNARHVPYRKGNGETADEADGYCRPFSFEITDAVKPAAENQVSIVGTRHFINELGTGGLLAPVVLYRQR